MKQTLEQLMLWSPQFEEIGISPDFLKLALETCPNGMEINIDVPLRNLQRLQTLKQHHLTNDLYLVMLSNNIPWIINYLSAHPEIDTDEQLIFNIAYMLALNNHLPTYDFFLQKYALLGELAISESANTLAHLIPPEHFDILVTTLNYFPNLFYVANAEGKTLEDLLPQDVMTRLLAMSEQEPSEQVEVPFIFPELEMLPSDYLEPDADELTTLTNSLIEQNLKLKRQQEALLVFTKATQGIFHTPLSLGVFDSYSDLSLFSNLDDKQHLAKLRLDLTTIHFEIQAIQTKINKLELSNIDFLLKEVFLTSSCSQDEAGELLSALRENWSNNNIQKEVLDGTLAKIIRYKYVYQLSKSDIEKALLENENIVELYSAVIQDSPELFDKAYLYLIETELAILQNKDFQQSLFEFACLNSNITIAQYISALFPAPAGERFTLALFTHVFSKGSPAFVIWFLQNNPQLATDFQGGDNPDTDDKKECALYLSLYQPNSKKRAFNNSNAASTTTVEKKSRSRENLIDDATKTINIHSTALGMMPLPKLLAKNGDKPSQLSDSWSFYTSPDRELQAHSSVHETVLENDWFKMTYYSFSEQPNKNHRVTMTFASRVLSGLYPDETQGGRVILLLTREDMSNDESLQSLVIQTLMTPFRDICVIDSIKMSAMQNSVVTIQSVDEKEIGLIMTRRLAGFYLAHMLQLDHAIFVDDNLKRYGIKFASNQPEEVTWKNIYEFLAHQALQQNVSCVGPRRSFQADNDEDDSDDVAELNLSTKLFYIRLDQIRQHFPDFSKISTLLTHHRKMWGSDVFFQFMLMLNCQIGSVDSSSFLIEHAPGMKHAALKTVSPATEWLKMVSTDFIPDAQPRVCELIKQCVQQNIDRYNKKLLPLRELDLKEMHAKREGENYIVNPPKLTPLNLSLSQPTEAQLLASTAINNNQQGLHQHQLEALRTLINNLGQIGFVQCPPRTGKTLIIWVFIALLTRVYANWNCHILLVTPQRGLVTQLYQDAKKYNEYFRNLMLRIMDIVKVSSNENDISSRLLAISNRLLREPAIIIGCEKSITQLLAEKPDFLNNVGLTITDEAHVISSSLLNLFVEHAKKTGTTALAVSATMGASAKNIYQRALYELSLAEAYRRGIVCPVIISAFAHEYSESTVTKLIYEFPNFLKHIYHPNGKRFGDTKNVVFANSIADAEKLEKVLTENNIPSVVINSKKNGSGERKEEALRQFCDRSSATNILILVRMLSYGATIDCDSVISLKNSKQGNDKNADSTYQAVARCLNNQTLAQVQPASPQIRVAAIVLLLKANITHLQELIEDPNADRYCHQNFLAQQAKVDDERTYRLVKVTDEVPQDSSSDEPEGIPSRTPAC